MRSPTNTNRRVIQFLRVAGAALVVLVVHISKPSFWTSHDRHASGGSWSPRNEKRNLQNVRFMASGQPGTQLQEHHAWSPPTDNRKGSTEHYSYKLSHSHHNRGQERNTDDDDSKDENDDDDSEDSKDSKDKNDDDRDDDNNDSSENQSGSDSDSGSGRSSSSSVNETETAAIQSSVVTNLDGVNIGNTITIINIGTGSGGQQPSSASSDNDLIGSNPFAVNTAGRSTITSAAIRAFCDSIGCGSNATTTGSTTGSTSVPGSGSATFSLGGGNGSRGQETTYEMPAVRNGGSVEELSTWLLLISILMQVL